MSLITHAKKELEIAGLFDKDSDYDGMVGTAVMELMETFSKQGHSGHSASIVVDIFNKLARYKPLSPLTGEDSEWHVAGVGGNSIMLYQNNRNSAVFKESKDGKPYFIDAYVKRTPNGNRWCGRLNLKDGRYVGQCYIKDFSNMPTIVIDVLEKEIKKDGWEMWIEDESQLEELAKYYEFEIIKKEEVPVVTTNPDDIINALASVQPMTAPLKEGFFTMAESDLDDDIKKQISDMCFVRKAIRVKHPIGKEFVEGHMDCPICGKKRWYMISDHYNGHIHSKCETETCVNWME